MLQDMFKDKPDMLAAYDSGGGSGGGRGKGGRGGRGRGGGGEDGSSGGSFDWRGSLRGLLSGLRGGVKGFASAFGAVLGFFLILGIGECICVSCACNDSYLGSPSAAHDIMSSDSCMPPTPTVKLASPSSPGSAEGIVAMSNHGPMKKSAQDGPNCSVLSAVQRPCFPHCTGSRYSCSGGCCGWAAPARGGGTISTACRRAPDLT